MLTVKKLTALFFSIASVICIHAQTETPAREAQMTKLINDWKNSRGSDSLFVAKNSELRPAMLYYPAGTFPTKPGVNFATSKKGDVLGPSKEGNTYHIYKNNGAKKSADSVQVSHILYAYAGAIRATAGVSRSQAEAKKSADSLCRLIRSGKVLLENVVEQVTDDPGSKMGNKGNYGWFTHESPFVAEFKEAGFNNPVGSTVVVETIFGYHIIQVEAKTKEKEYNTFWEIVQRVDTCFTMDGSPIIISHAKYPGGNQNAVQYIKTQQAEYDSLNAPRFKGKSVLVKFDVLEDGSITRVMVFNGPISGTAAEKQLVEIVKSMSNWNPAKSCAGAFVEAQTLTVVL